MTDLEKKLIDSLNEQQIQVNFAMQSIDHAVQSVAQALQSVEKQQERIITLLSTPTQGEALETTFKRVLNEFHTSLISSLEKLQKQSAN